MSGEKVIPLQGSKVEAHQSPAHESSKKEITLSGLWAVMLAIGESVPSAQKYATELMGDTAAVDNLEQKYADAWLKIMATGPDSDQAKIAKEVASKDDPKTKAAKVNALTLAFQQHTTLSDESNTFYTTLDNGLSENNSNVNNGISANVALYERIYNTAKSETQLTR